MSENHWTISKDLSPCILFNLFGQKLGKHLNENDFSSPNSLPLTINKSVDWITEASNKEEYQASEGQALCILWRLFMKVTHNLKRKLSPHQTVMSVCDPWWTKLQKNRLFSFSYQHHSTNALYSHFIHLLSMPYHLSNWQYLTCDPEDRHTTEKLKINGYLPSLCASKMKPQTWTSM